jgi:hypothetical protein
MALGDTNRQLVELIKQFNLTRNEVAGLTASRSKSTVDRWLLPQFIDDQPNPNWRQMPEPKMALLLMTLRYKRKTIGKEETRKRAKLAAKKILRRALDSADIVSHDASTV